MAWGGRQAPRPRSGERGYSVWRARLQGMTWAGAAAAAAGNAQKSRFIRRVSLVSSLDQLDHLGSRRLVGIAALVLTILCWGTVPVLLRDLADATDAWTANGFRYPLSSLMFWPILWAAWTDRRLTRDLVVRCTVPAFFALTGQILWAIAHYHLKASETAFLIRFSALWAIGGAMLLFSDERWLLGQFRFYASLILLSGGFFLFSSISGSARVGGSRDGLWIMFFCSLAFGLYAVSIRRFLPHVDAILAFAIVCQLVSLGTIAGMFAYGDVQSLATLKSRDWLQMVTSSFLGIGFGHVLLYIAVQRLGTAVASSCQTLTPFVTAVLASATLGEALSRGQWFAGLLMVIGTFLLMTAKRPHEPRQNRRMRLGLAARLP